MIERQHPTEMAHKERMEEAVVILEKLLYFDLEYVDDVYVESITHIITPACLLKLREIEGKYIK